MWLFTTNLAGARQASVLITNEGTVPVNLQYYRYETDVGRPVYKRFYPAARISPGDGRVEDLPTAVGSSARRVSFALTEHTFRSSAARMLGKIPPGRVKQALPKSWLTVPEFGLTLEASNE
jgi:hypothetical protein